MAARSIASLTVSFGLVAIPVKLYSATQPAGGIAFNLLHQTCGSRLRQQYLCIKEEVVVPREEIAKGYEFSKDQYVMFSPEELKQLEEVGTRSVEVIEFVPADAIDPVFYDKAYYLAPDKGGAKSYALFAEALRRARLTALGRWATRGKQYIVQLRPVDEGLVMQQLLYAAEVRRIDELQLTPTDVKEAELKLALQFIEQSKAAAFLPEAYRDEVKARIESAVQEKVAGKEITITEAPPEGGAQVIDLMAALRASLAKRGAPAASEENVPARKPPKRASGRETVKPKRMARK